MPLRAMILALEEVKTRQEVLLQSAILQKSWCAQKQDLWRSVMWLFASPTAS